MKRLIPQKNYFIAILLLIVSGSSFAQNIFPGSGYAGINNMSPHWSLDILTDLTGYSGSGVLWNYGSLHIINQRRDNTWAPYPNGPDVLSVWPQMVPISGQPYMGANPFFVINATGQVGINTYPNVATYYAGSIPKDIYQFDVNGDAHVNGFLTIGPVTGANAITIPNAGTTSGYGLYVAQGILTEKVKIALHNDPVNWSDFVFNKDYKLMPLSILEGYVKTNKHLPEIPSTQDVAKDGIDVAAMDAKLLQKVEELTLYVIDQQKQLALLQKQNKTLQKKVAALQK